MYHAISITERNYGRQKFSVPQQGSNPVPVQDPCAVVLSV